MSVLKLMTFLIMSVCLEPHKAVNIVDTDVRAGGSTNRRNKSATALSVPLTCSILLCYYGQF